MSFYHCQALNRLLSSCLYSETARKRKAANIALHALGVAAVSLDVINALLENLSFKEVHSSRDQDEQNHISDIIGSPSEKRLSTCPAVVGRPWESSRSGDAEKWVLWVARNLCDSTISRRDDLTTSPQRLRCNSPMASSYMNRHAYA